MRILLTLVALLGCISVSAQQPDGKELLKKIDQNMSSKSRVFTSKMVIHGRRNVRTIESKSWSEGEDRAFTEYLFPAREQGTKMLKLKDQLWIYSPSTDRIIQIAGHMLRQTVMGSDLSYEDMMEDSKLEKHYKAEVTGSETLNSRSCWVLKLTAIDPEMAYQVRKLWVEKEHYVPVKEELYAKSGTLLKRTEMSDIQLIDGRWFPKNIVFKDMLREGSGTEFIISDIRFDEKIPEYIFTKASLKK